jgi:predicted HicB family RNase H-like nuclease
MPKRELKSEIVYIRVEPKLKKKIVAAAKKSHMSMSEYIGQVMGEKVGR